MTEIGPKDPTRTAASPPEAAFEKVSSDEAEKFPELAGYKILKKLG